MWLYKTNEDNTMYELKSSRKSTRNKKIVARIKQQLIKRQEFFLRLLSGYPMLP